jgi:hypothetical protein
MEMVALENSMETVEKIQRKNQENFKATGN